MTDRALRSVFDEVKKNLIDLLMEDAFIRGDYKECAIVLLQILGGIPPKGFKWYRPGAVHHARWMVTILYCTKMYAFREQLNFSREEVEKLKKFVMFSIFYIIPWLHTTKAADAAVFDLELYKNLHLYGLKVDKNCAERALKIFGGQLWYLTEELLPMTLFSERVSESEKKLIATTLVKAPKITAQKGKPVFPITRKNTKLANLVGSKSWYFFDILNASGNWLTTPVNTWNENEEYKYKNLLNIVKNMQT